VLRAQVILGLPYGMPIDVWSCACILAELFTGYPLFPGENEAEQLLCIMEVLGPPPEHLVTASPRKKTFFEPDGSPRIVANSRGKKRRPGSKVTPPAIARAVCYAWPAMQTRLRVLRVVQDLTTALRCNDASFISFLEGCLQWDPDLRFSPDMAFQHPWIQVCCVHVLFVGAP
jgi:serine/threonine protein kinase